MGENRKRRTDEMNLQGQTDWSASGKDIHVGDGD